MSMKAETAYHVIQALDGKELPRLYKMLGVAVPEDQESPGRKPLITDAQATENLYRLLRKQKKNLLKNKHNKTKY